VRLVQPVEEARRELARHAAQRLAAVLALGLGVAARQEALRLLQLARVAPDLAPIARARFGS